MHSNLFFNMLYNDLRESQWGIDMSNTVEASPWHREANVMVHTDMLLQYYELTFAEHRTEKQALWSKIACLFHDVGKPPARIEKYSEERGTYYAYHGHEQISARMWVDFAARNYSRMGFAGHLSPHDVAFISQMIHNHVPFDTKNYDKLKAIRSTITHYRGEEGHQAWMDMLNCDQRGRISDDQEAKLIRVKEWFDGYLTVTA